MNAREIDRYKRLLLQKQQELAESGAQAKAPVPAAGIPQGDVIDQASADSEAELEIRLRRTDGRLLHAIDEALTRIRNSTFGVCEECGQRISKARQGRAVDTLVPTVQGTADRLRVGFSLASAAQSRLDGHARCVAQETQAPSLSLSDR